MKDDHGIDIYDIIKDRDPPFGFEAQLTARMDMTRDLQHSVRKRFRRRNAEAGSIVLDQDADIVAVLMQKDNDLWSNFNFAKRPNRGLASTMKGILLAIGMQENLVTIYSTFDDTCEGLEDWCPRNWDGREGRTMTLENALYNSNNRIFAKLYKKIKANIGVEGFAEYMGKLGFDQKEFLEAAKMGDAVSLGARGGSPLQLAAAYMAIATGSYKEPTIIKSLSFAGGIEPRFLAEERLEDSLFDGATVNGLKVALGKAGKKYTAGAENVYAGIKTGTASKATHLFIAGYFMPKADNHETYSLAILAVPTDGKKSLGRRAYAGNTLGPVVEDFIKKFSRTAPRLTDDQITDLEEDEARLECDSLFYQYSPQEEKFLGRYGEWADQGEFDHLTIAYETLNTCKEKYTPNTYGHEFFEKAADTVMGLLERMDDMYEHD